MKNQIQPERFQEEQYEQKGEETIQKIPRELSKPVSKDMLVLAELHRGTRNFESVLKNTGLARDELNSILEDLEKKGLMRVEQKNGLFGAKVELYPTEKGSKKFYT